MEIGFHWQGIYCVAQIKKKVSIVRVTCDDIKIDYISEEMVKEIQNEIAKFN